MKHFLIITLLALAAPLYAMDRAIDLSVSEIHAINKRIDLFMWHYTHKTRDMNPAQINSTYSCHAKALTHYLVTGSIVDDDHADRLISDEQYAQEHKKCVRAQALTLGAPTATFATATDALAAFRSTVAHGNTSLHVLSTIQQDAIEAVASRIIFLAALHQQKHHDSDWGKYTIPCHIKTFVHYCVTGIMINDAHVDELIFDETYYREYELFSQAKTIAGQIIEQAIKSSNS